MSLFDFFNAFWDVDSPKLSQKIQQKQIREGEKGTTFTCTFALTVINIYCFFKRHVYTLMQFKSAQIEVCLVCVT